MTEYLCLAFRFLSPLFHGRKDGGVPEWPPSPLRVMQALVAAAARTEGRSFATAAFEWLERQPPPLVFAPAASAASGYRLSVPNNSMDVVAKAWVRGGDGKPGEQRAMKTVRPMRLMGSEAVRFAWVLDRDPVARAHAERLSALAEVVVALGWGLDLVVGSGAVLPAAAIEAIREHRWVPGEEAAGGLRVPIPGTTAALEHRHGEWLVRTSLDDEPYRPPSALTAFRVIRYIAAEEDSPRATTALRLMDPSGDGMRAFDCERWTTVVAGMMRHVASGAAVACGWPERDVAAIVLGHGESKGVGGHAPASSKRLAYLPLPTIEGRPGDGAHVGQVRRVLVTSFGDGAVVPWAAGALAGRTLTSEGDGKPVAVLAPCVPSDPVVGRYIGRYDTWATVTPIVLPGYEDHGGLRKKLAKTKDSATQKRLLLRLEARTDQLVRKALEQSGVAHELATRADVEWSGICFWAGGGRASDFKVPSHLTGYSRLHVRVAWRDENGNPIQRSGPLCAGSGRFYGIGLFAGVS